jgi:ABC-type lipoprotein export system ATPase subunit
MTSVAQGIKFVAQRMKLIVQCMTSVAQKVMFVSHMMKLKPQREASAAQRLAQRVMYADQFGFP